MENASNVTTITAPISKVLVQALETPCPLCKSTDLSKNLWALNGGEVDAVECNRCFAGAPAESWVKRK